jgi:exosortase
MSANLTAIKSHLVEHRYVYILLALSTLLNVHVWYELVIDWIVDPNYSHGFLVIPVAAYLLYRQRGQLEFPVKTCGMGVALAVVASVGLVLGVAASQFFVARLSLVLQITGIGLAYLGRANFRRAWFAFFFLLFMIPVPAVIYYQATLPMQMLATQVTAFLLEIIGVPAVRQGNIIHLPDYSLEVVEACSGLRSLVTLIALGSLYAWLYMRGRVRAVVLALATIPIAMLANVVRICITAVAAYAVSQDLAETFLHEISGLLVFVSALIMLIILGAVLRWTERSTS